MQEEINKYKRENILFAIIITLAFLSPTIIGLFIYVLPKFLISRFVGKNMHAKYAVFKDMAIAGLVLGILSLIGSMQNTTTNTPNSNTPTQDPTPKTEIYQEMPETSVIWKDDRKKGVAPFTISTQGENGYFARLVNKETDRDYVQVFVRGGESIKVMVPLGEYNLKYATGKNWIGKDRLFGKDGTTYMKADTIFDFYADEEGYVGHKVLLYLQPNGNLHTSQISAEDF